MTYNGWRNYETWATNLWLSNDPDSNAAAQEAASGPDDDRTLRQGAAALREMVDELLVGDEAPASLATDLLRYALDSVDWDAVAEAFREE